jgi:hypothetical protein
MDSTLSVPPKMNPEGRNVKKESDALGTAENESGSTKLEKGSRHPQYVTTPVPPKMIPVAQNMKAGNDALDTVENESGRTKHENGTRRARYRRKRIRERKT